MIYQVTTQLGTTLRVNAPNQAVALAILGLEPGEATFSEPQKEDSDG